MIKLQGATKIFDQRGIAGLHGMDLSIRKGTVFALMGPNGSGKTTLLNVLSKKIPLDSGSVIVEGKIHFFEKKDPPADINVQMFLIESIQAEVETEKKVQLSRDMASIFEFTYQLRQTIGQLSQGQLQKVLMAAELINQPDILFLDEPFIHLDPMTRKDILDSLFTYLRQRETTVIWITHERDEALRFADQVGLIQHGKFEQTSSAVEILTKPRNLFVAQFFGHQNFIKVTGKDGIWKTPWGELKSHVQDHEGYLIVPTTGWSINKSSNFEGTITKTYPQFFSMELAVEINDKEFKVSLPLNFHSEWKTGDKIQLVPDLNQCLVISL